MGVSPGPVLLGRGQSGMLFPLRNSLVSAESESGQAYPSCHILQYLPPSGLRKTVDGEAWHPGDGPDALERLRCYSWPGNIRELQSVLKQALLLASGTVLLPAFLLASTLEGPRPC